MTASREENQHDALLDAVGRSDGSTNKPTLYEALGLTSAATEHEIRKSYFKMAIKVHPDRNAGDSRATERFQSLQKIYSVLSDPEKRRIYDQTGQFEDEDGVLSEKNFESLYEYYKAKFREVTVDAIEDFREKYQESEEEMNDVLSYYDEFEGNMQKVFDHVMLSDPEVDSVRFQGYIDSALEDGRVQTCFEAYERWKKALARSTKGTKKQKKKQNKRKEAGMSSLEEAIRSRQLATTRRTSGLDALAQKYGCDVMPEDDPLASEEAFLQARARLEEEKKKT
eukprot:jgi/Picre1/31728/NNA_007079.t1